MAFLTVLRAWITAACVCHVFAYRVAKKAMFDQATHASAITYDSVSSTRSRRTSADEHDVAKMEKRNEYVADDSKISGTMNNTATLRNRAHREVASFERQQFGWFSKIFNKFFSSGKNPDDDYDDDYNPPSDAEGDSTSSPDDETRPTWKSPIPTPGSLPPYGWSCSAIRSTDHDMCSSSPTQSECLKFEDLCVWSSCEATQTWKAKFGADKDLCPFHHVKSTCVKSKQCRWKVIGTCTATNEWRAKYPSGVDLCPLLQDKPSCTENQHCNWDRSIGTCTGTNEWRAKYPSAVDLCPLLKDKPSCSENQHCKWDRSPTGLLGRLKALLPSW